MIFGLFKKKKVKESNFQILNELVNVFSRPTEKELYLLNMLGQAYKLSKTKREQIIEKNNTPRLFPKNSIEKTQLVSDMCMLMCIKNEIKVDEYDYCLEICKQMNIDDREVDNQIKLIISNASHLLNGAYDEKLLDSSFREVINYKIQERIGFNF